MTPTIADNPYKLTMILQEHVDVNQISSEFQTLKKKYENASKNIKLSLAIRRIFKNET